MLEPKGIIPAVITPFTADDRLDETATRQLARRLLAAGVHGLFCLGTNGEFFAMSLEEKSRFVEIIVEEANGSVPVYAGAGANSTRETVQLCETFEALGVDALSVITPYFLPLSQAELTAHYRSVAAGTSLPVLLYNIPQRTGVAISPDTAERLAAVPNIVGIKDSSGSFETILQFLERSGPGFSVLAGTDSLILWTLLAGGSGAIAATANLFPELGVSIYDGFTAGKLEAAMAAQDKLRAFRGANQSLGTLPSVLKEAMNYLGYPAGQPRAPVAPLDEISRQSLYAILHTYSGQEAKS